MASAMSPYHCAIGRQLELPDIAASAVGRWLAASGSDLLLGGSSCVSYTRPRSLFSTTAFTSVPEAWSSSHSHWRCSAMTTCATAGRLQAWQQFCSVLGGLPRTGLALFE